MKKIDSTFLLSAVFCALTFSAVALADFQASKEGIAYPANATFNLSDFRGNTYVSFLKANVKPALDRLSDANNGGGGGFDVVGSSAYVSGAANLDPTTLLKYKGAKWSSKTKSYVGALPDAEVTKVYESLKKVTLRQVGSSKTKVAHSTVDQISYYDKDDKDWASKNDMAIAVKDAGVKGDAFDLATLYALTSGVGVKVKIDENNINYHVLYKTGKTKPSLEVMSGRSFATSPEHLASDASDPVFLKALENFLKSTADQKAFYKALILTLANSDSSTWSSVSPKGQSVLSDFLTVYTAESDRHLMVNLKDGIHPWEVDLAAVTFVSSVSAKLGKVVVGGALVDGNLGKWFAPSPNNVAGGPQRSGIGITRKDRQAFQRAIHAYEMSTAAGKKAIQNIQSIIGRNGNDNDVIQGVFEYLSSTSTPEKMGSSAETLANAMADFIALANQDAAKIAASFK